MFNLQDVLLSLNERGLVRNVPIADSYFITDFLNEIDDAMYKIVQVCKVFFSSSYVPSKGINAWVVCDDISLVYITYD